MTPTLPEILRGNFQCLAQPATPDMAGDFMASRVGVIALLNLLAAQEAERGSAAVIAENDAIAALLADAGIVPAAAPVTLIPAALDAHNAGLRRALIALHEAVEMRGDRDLDARILALYAGMAAGRRLELPPLPAS